MGDDAGIGGGNNKNEAFDPYPQNSNWGNFPQGSTDLDQETWERCDPDVFFRNYRHSYAGSAPAGSQTPVPFLQMPLPLYEWSQMPRSQAMAKYLTSTPPKSKAPKSDPVRRGAQTRAAWGRDRFLQKTDARK